MTQALVLNEGQTAELLSAVVNAAREGARGPLLRQLMATAYARAGERSGRDPTAFDLFHEAYTLALKGYRYVPDPGGEELIQPTETTLSEGLGDCDDATALVLALARAAGLGGRVVLLSRHVEGELKAMHAYAEVRGPSGYIPADLSGYRGVGEVPPAPVGAVKHYVNLPAGGPGVGFLGGLIGGLLGLGAAKQQRKAAEAAGNAQVAAQRLANEGALEVAEEQTEAVKAQAAALVKSELIQGRVRAEELESRERVVSGAYKLARDLAPVAGVVALVWLFARATKTLRAPAAARPPAAPSKGRARRARKTTKPKARKRKVAA